MSSVNKIRRPILCALTKFLNKTDTIKEFVQSSWKGKKEFVMALFNDQWFIHSPSMFGQMHAKGEELLGRILSRTLDGCQKGLQKIGIYADSQIGKATVIRFISSNIEERYALAQKTIREWLEQ